MKVQTSLNRWQYSWVVVFWLNMIVPIWLGWQETLHKGRAGMAAAILLIGLTGLWLCGASKRFAFVAVTGAAFTAALQFAIAALQPVIP
ncbi:MAG TPA: hypothetical protein VNC50_14565, partial [Planctomycetia bacterium]|nr:hypothetical protein [Planctomycetia bacterium]